MEFIIHESAFSQRQFLMKNTKKKKMSSPETGTPHITVNDWLIKTATIALASHSPLHLNYKMYKHALLVI